VDAPPTDSTPPAVAPPPSLTPPGSPSMDAGGMVADGAAEPSQSEGGTPSTPPPSGVGATDAAGAEYDAADAQGDAGNPGGGDQGDNGNEKGKDGGK
jgi:hypothetical protein